MALFIWLSLLYASALNLDTSGHPLASYPAVRRRNEPPGYERPGYEASYPRSQSTIKMGGAATFAHVQYVCKQVLVLTTGHLTGTGAD